MKASANSAGDPFHGAVRDMPMGNGTNGPPHNAEELIIEVDGEDNPIGPAGRRDFDWANRIHRSSHLIISSPEGRILLQKRVATKKIFPSSLDFSVSGTVSWGESYLDCIVREAREELGIEIEPRELFTWKGFHPEDKAFRRLFSALHSGPFDIQMAEVSEILWVERAELRNMISTNPEIFNPPFIEGIGRFLSNL